MAHGCLPLYLLKNYFKVAWRNLLKNKVFSIINIAGLATGLACFILIMLYVSDEISYDKYNEKADRIYRINSLIKMGGSELKLNVASDPMGPTLKQDFPQIEEYVRFYNSNGSKYINKGGEFINEPSVVPGTGYERRHQICLYIFSGCGFHLIAGMYKFYQFVYRTLDEQVARGVGWWIFIISGLIAILVTLFTISFQAIRAAVSNPVKSLRTE